MTGSSRVALLFVALLLAGCGGGTVPPALVASAPTPAEVGDARRLAGRIADEATLGLTLANDVSALVAVAPLSPGAKDKFDCAVLRVTGVDASPVVSQVCGPLPTIEAAPLTVARRKLQAVTSCPSLRATTAELLGIIDPLIAQLSFSDNVSLAFAAAALRTTFAFSRKFLVGGGLCS